MPKDMTDKQALLTLLVDIELVGTSGYTMNQKYGPRHISQKKCHMGPEWHTFT